MTQAIYTAAAVTAGELLEQLQEMISASGRNPETIYVTIKSDSIRLALVEETLTDGSTVHNIEMREACS